MTHKGHKSDAVGQTGVITYDLAKRQQARVYMGILKLLSVFSFLPYFKSVCWSMSKAGKEAGQDIRGGLITGGREGATSANTWECQSCFQFFLFCPVFISVYSSMP